jgi:hypothetical protein
MAPSTRHQEAAEQMVVYQVPSVVAGVLGLGLGLGYGRLVEITIRIDCRL